MFGTTTDHVTAPQLRVSFLTCVKAGIGFSLGAVLLPAIAIVIQAVTKLQLATALMVLHVIH